MPKQQRVGKIAAAAMATILSVGVFANLAAIAVELKDGDTQEGTVELTSPSFTYRDAAGVTRRARGDEYTFRANRRDVIEVEVEAAEGSRFKPVLVLLSPTRKQIALDTRNGLIRFRVVTPGVYRLLVLGQPNTAGDYVLTINGLSTSVASPTPTSSPSPTPTISEADRVMRDVLQLRVVGCGVPNVSKINIGGEQRCTLDLSPPKDYNYDASARRLVEVVAAQPTPTTPPASSDPRRQLLVSNGLQVMDTCPANPLVPLAIVTFHEQNQLQPQTFSYCLQPTAQFPAGDYAYNTDTRRLEPDTRISRMRQGLGLEVTAYCPQADAWRLISLSYTTNFQIFRYCAPPVANRFIQGNYIYRPGATPAEDKVCRPGGFLGLGTEVCVNATGGATPNP